MTPEVYADKLLPRFGMNSSGSMSDEVVGIFLEHDSSKMSVAFI